MISNDREFKNFKNLLWKLPVNRIGRGHLKKIFWNIILKLNLKGVNINNNNNLYIYYFFLQKKTKQKKKKKK